MKLSVVIPAYNEAESITETVTGIRDKLNQDGISHEIIVINDNSKDNTLEVLEHLQKQIKSLIVYTNEGPNGYGYAVRYGLERFTGDCVAIMMADASEIPEDLVNFYKVMLKKNCDCVFGHRFIKGGSVYDYPYMKLFMNRIFNHLVSISFRIRYTDLTNAFKLYKRETIEGVKPFLSPQFNLTLELPLKAIVRGYSYSIVPNSWRNRKFGVAKLKIREMGSRYFFIYLYCLIEKHFSKGDYRKDI
ncbi:MAG: glycosyltransferase family 2 protein [Chitinophagales bacterium]|nr:glycosyltransferase family 2 protein [Chitinophagales bacterium]